MNTLHFKYAVEIEKTGSISKAAENLYMGQPALSRTIKELENSLGITIFKRTSTGVVPTKKGSEFLVYAKNILSQLSEMETLYKEDSDYSQKLSISAPRSSYVSKAFSRFLKQLDKTRDIDIKYKETNSTRTLNKLSIGEYNLGIVRYETIYEDYFLKTFEDKKFNFEPLWEFECVVVMDKRHALSNKESISPNELRPYIELVHGDNIIPYLTGENTQINSTNDDSSQKIYIFERGSQFDLLQNIPESYMMVAPIPNDVLESHNLVQKKISAQGQGYKDVLVYRSSYNLTDLDNLLLRKIKDVINETSH